MKKSLFSRGVAFALVAVAGLAASAAAMAGVSPDVLGSLAVLGGLPLAFGPTAVKTVTEQIADLTATRGAKAAEAQGIMQKSLDEGRSTDAAEGEAFDTINGEIAQIDKDLARLKSLETMMGSGAAPAVVPAGAAATTIATAGRAPAVVRTVKNDEAGVGFARFALAMYAGKGNAVEAKAFAENHFASDARLATVMKAAVAAGTTTSATWAGNLVEYQTLSSEFIEFLRPRTIVGQFGQGGIPALRRIPFKVRIPGKTGSGTAAWVGEGYRKPVTASAYDAVTLDFAKIAAISVITEEVARFSDPSLQNLVRDDLAEAVIERVDVDFINPGKAAGTGAGLSPASITNGVTPINSTATSDEADIRAEIALLWATADNTNMPASSAVYITNAATVRRLIGVRTTLGAAAFPTLTMTGGTLDGVPVIVSNYVPADTSGALFILAFASEIYIADDGMVNIDVSREATIFLDDAAATATPTAAQLVSMFQTNQLAIRAERYITWKKRRPQAVAYLDNVKWGT